MSGISQTATNTVVAMAELWRIEDEARGKSADIRGALRQDQSAAIVTRLFDMWEKELGKVPGKSKTAEAIRYALTRREALQRFLTDGRIEIDSNIVEPPSDRRQLQGKTACLPVVRAAVGLGPRWQRFSRHAN